MDPLPTAPRTFQEIVEADLRRAVRLVVKVQDEIDPQLRIATPEGDFWIAVTLPSDDAGRRGVLAALSTFMVWKQAQAFTFASELVEPDSIYCAGISARERHACLSRIRRIPRPWTAASFGGVEWLPEDAIDPELIALLPRAPRALTPKEVAACNAWFGKEGKFPAVHIGTGEVRGV
jgi:hypothetical protein